MPDVFTKAKRSEVMSRIRSRGNKDTELVLARLLRAHGITGWRRQVRLRVACGKWRVAGKARSPVASPVTRHPSLTVRPDFVFPKLRTVVFVDGCFWHGCPKHGTKPKGNASFWRKKFAANKARDRRVNRALRAAGWRVLRVWEHELRKSGRRKAGKRKGGGQTTGRGNIQPSTFNLQHRTSGERGVLTRISRMIADAQSEE